MLDFALVCRVFLVACSSISKAALIIASGALLAQRGVLTSDVRQGMSHMAAGLLVPCLPMLTRTPHRRAAGESRPRRLSAPALRG